MQQARLDMDRVWFLDPTSSRAVPSPSMVPSQIPASTLNGGYSRLGEVADGRCSGRGGKNEAPGGNSALP